MGKTILVADDSKTIQKVVEMTFEKTEFSVFGVNSGDDALSRITEVQPDLVLADIGMPGRDGYAVCAAIKGQPTTANIPVVLLCSGQTPVDESRIAEARADGHLAKPFETQALISIVKGLTGADLQSQVPASFAQTLAQKTDVVSAAPVAPVIDDLGVPSAPPNPFGPPSAAPSSAPAPVPQAPPAFAASEPPMAMSEDIAFEEDVDIEDIDPIDESDMAMPSGPSLEPPPPPGAASSGAPVDVWALAEGDEAPAAAQQAIAQVSIEEPVSSPPPVAQAPQRIAEAAAPAVASAAAAAVPGLAHDELVRIAREVIEQVAWEVVPDLAEAIIKEELRRLTRD